MDEKTAAREYRREGLAALGAVLVIVGVLLAGYFYVVHPLWTRFVKVPPVQRELSLYTEGVYRDYEDGQAFAQLVDSLGFARPGEPIGFYHSDTKLQDSPVYGKASDYFSLDLQFVDGGYLLAKEAFLRGQSYEEKATLGDYEFYLMKTGDGVCGVGFCDADEILRIALVTEISDCREFTKRISGRTDLDFDSQTTEE